MADTETDPFAKFRVQAPPAAAPEDAPELEAMRKAYSPQDKPPYQATPDWYDKLPDTLKEKAIAQLDQLVIPS